MASASASTRGIGARRDYKVVIDLPANAPDDHPHLVHLPKETDKKVVNPAITLADLVVSIIHQPKCKDDDAWNLVKFLSQAHLYCNFTLANSNCRYIFVKKINRLQVLKAGPEIATRQGHSKPSGGRKLDCKDVVEFLMAEDGRWEPRRWRLHGFEETTDSNAIHFACRIVAHDLFGQYQISPGDTYKAHFCHGHDSAPHSPPVCGHQNCMQGAWQRLPVLQIAPRPMSMDDHKDDIPGVASGIL